MISQSFVTRCASIAIGIALLVPSTLFASGFGDVHSNDWFSTYVEELASKNIVSSNANFFPNRTITRAELSKMAVNSAAFAGLIPPTTRDDRQLFCDIPKTHWAEHYVRVLEGKGITGVSSACPQGRNFLPNNSVTRAEALKILFKIFDLNPTGQSGFQDVERSAWYSSYINTATNLHIVNGYSDGTFHPNGLLTRAEMSKIVSLMIAHTIQADPTASVTPVVIQTPTPTPPVTGTHQIVITAAQSENALREAIGNAMPGDEIALAAGTYRLSRQLWIDRKGTAEHPIIIRSKDGVHAAKIMGSPEEGINIGDEASYIILDGLEVSNMGDNVIHIQNAHHITLQNIKAHDAGTDGDVIKVNQADHISIIHNDVARSGNRPSCPGGNCWQELIDFVDVNDSLIQNNTMSDFGNLAGYVKGGSTNVTIDGNTISGQRAGAGDPAWGIGGWTDSELIHGQYEANNITFTNNTLSNNSYGALGIYDASQVSIRNNLFTGNHGSLIEFRAGNGPAEKSQNITISANTFNHNQTSDTSICRHLDHELTGLTISGNLGNNSSILAATSCNED